MDDVKLISLAIEARKNAYTPYSRYKVGAAIQTVSGKIYTGCNIECVSYSPTTCAERTALAKAVSAGEKEFKAIAIVGGPEKEKESFSDFAYPCGVCRQFLREFCDPKLMRVIVAKSIDEKQVYTLDELLPHSFGPDYLE